MKHWLIPILSICFSVVMVNAETITVEEAKSIAAKVLAADSISVVEVSSSYCILQNCKDKGFAVISLKKNAERRILGFSNESFWDKKNLPPVLLEWIGRLDTILCRIKNGFDPGIVIVNEGRSIEPLLTCHWHQNSPYNDLTPVISDGNVKTVAGCVAIAAAQITYYWRKDNPRFTLSDTPTYIYGGAPVEYVVPKGSPNNWDLIKDYYDKTDSKESRAAAAQLCYVLGTSSYLNYASSTGGHISTAATALYNQYHLLSDYITKSSITQKEWESLLYNELVNGRPIMCSGSGNGGHAFVCDGYDSRTKLFHFNFGWGGSGDGYFPVDDSTISMGGYYEGQTVVYNIHPQNRNVTAQIYLQECMMDSEREEYVLTIINNGTLPINTPMLYILSDGQEFDSLGKPFWKGDTIPNDGSEYKIFFDKNEFPEDDTFKFYFTDEYGTNILNISKKEIELKIRSVMNDNISQRIIFDLHGKIVAEPKKSGIFIINNGGSIKKKIFLK